MPRETTAAITTMCARTKRFSTWSQISLRHAILRARLLTRVSSMIDQIHSLARGRSECRMRSTNIVMIRGPSQDDLARKRPGDVRCRPLVTTATRPNFALQPISQDTNNCRIRQNCGRVNNGAMVGNNGCKTQGKMIES